MPQERKKIYCITCKNAMDLKSYHKNKEKRSLYSKQYRESNPDKVEVSRKQGKKWMDERPGYMNNWFKKKRSNDINYKLKHVLYERLRGALKNSSKGKKTLEMLGCSIEDFKIYLEKQFDKDMNWGNYGKKGWHIDHKKPVSLFDLSSFEEQNTCFHYTNMQPMWWYDNLTKSAKY